MKTITIGRSNQCDIVIANDNISRIHAELSLVNNQYVYKDMSKNGTNIGGHILHNEKIIIVPGVSVLLANRVPLPWGQVYALLPATGGRSCDEVTEAYKSNPVTCYRSPGLNRDELRIGWGIIAFFIPLVGWIMYFCWKEDFPHRASQAAQWAWIGFGLGIFINIMSLV